MELYQLLRNPAVVQRPLEGPEAAEICQVFGNNPRWAFLENAPVMDKVWSFAGRPGMARRRLFDARLAYTLRHHGVGELATRKYQGLLRVRIRPGLGPRHGATLIAVGEDVDGLRDL